MEFGFDRDGLVLRQCLPMKANIPASHAFSSWHGQANNSGQGAGTRPGSHPLPLPTSTLPHMSSFSLAHTHALHPASSLLSLSLSVSLNSVSSHPPSPLLPCMVSLPYSLPAFWSLCLMPLICPIDLLPLPTSASLVPTHCLLPTFYAHSSLLPTYHYLHSQNNDMTTGQNK